MSKYARGAGDPLDMLGEEATEIAKDVFKARRFGMGSRIENYAGPTPREGITQELGDLLEVMNYLIRMGVLSRELIFAAMDNKHQRLKDLFGLDTRRLT